MRCRCTVLGLQVVSTCLPTLHIRLNNHMLATAAISNDLRPQGASNRSHPPVIQHAFLAAQAALTALGSPTDTTVPPAHSTAVWKPEKSSRRSGEHLPCMGAVQVSAHAVSAV